MTPKSATLLRAALSANCLFSLATGLIAILAAPAVATSLGLGSVGLIQVLGWGLALFSAGIAWTLARLRLGQAVLISMLDGLWVVTTAPLTLLPGWLSPTGAGWVLVLAALVALLAGLQLLGVRRVLRSGAPRGQYRHCVRVESTAEADALWRIVRDVPNIARYSAGLSASRLEAGQDPAPGAVRVCADIKGRQWAEEIVSLDDASRAIAFRFRAEAADFPFPFTAMTGGWSVTPSPHGGAYVDIWWIVTPKARRLGWLVVTLMTVALDTDLPRIVAAMEAAARGEPAPSSHRRPALGYC
ncbi:MAG: SRPBCC family protein [Maricaulaceae bacterium]